VAVSYVLFAGCLLFAAMALMSNHADPAQNSRCRCRCLSEALPPMEVALEFFQ
jgi:hypothetical protein